MILRVVAGAAAVSLALGMAGTSAAGSRERPRSLAVVASGESVRASQGSWCYFGPHSGMCADYAYPLRIRRSLRVEPGQRLRFQTHDATIESLSATLLRVRGRRIRERGELDAIQRAAKNPRAWRATIPGGARNANRIDVFARYEDGRGDSSWWAGIRLGE
jgi:hypothetical protein